MGGANCTCLTSAVTDLDVLESCEFTSKVAYPHQLKKQYAGVYEVRPIESCCV